MSELQAADEAGAVDQPAEQTPVEPDNTGADLATANPSEGEQNTDAAPSQDPAGYTKAINKQHKLARDFERRAIAAEQERDDLRTKHAPAPVADVAVPDLLDPYDDGYAKSLSDRDAAVRHNARNAAITAQQEEASARSQRQSQIDAAQAGQDRVDKFRGNATRLGVTEESFNKSVKSLLEYGLSDQIASQVMEDDEGPLIAQYLASNPLEMHRLNNADQFSAGRMWGEFKSKAAALKPTATNAPAPATAVNGGGMPPKSLGPPGATYE